MKQELISRFKKQYLDGFAPNLIYCKRSPENVFGNSETSCTTICCDLNMTLAAFANDVTQEGSEVVAMAGMFKPFLDVKYPFLLIAYFEDNEIDLIIFPMIEGKWGYGITTGDCHKELSRIFTLTVSEATNMQLTKKFGAVPSLN